MRIGGEAGQHSRLAAGGEDDVLGLEDAHGATVRDLNLAAAQQAGEALDDFDLLALHEQGYAGGVLVNDRVLAFENQGQVEHGVLAMQALLFWMFEVLPDLGGVEQRLGGHAADMEAGATELGILFDERGLEAVLAGADGSGVAPGTAADHDHVIGHRS